MRGTASRKSCIDVEEILLLSVSQSCSHSIYLKVAKMAFEANGDSEEHELRNKIAETRVYIEELRRQGGIASSNTTDGETPDQSRLSEMIEDAEVHLAQFKSEFHDLTSKRSR